MCLTGNDVWAECAIKSGAAMRSFSSDRTIREHGEQVRTAPSTR